MRNLGEAPLSDRWYIFKDGQSIGPLSAAEIRDALRSGTFDPFDLVSRDGSRVRRELVEVDEIFFNSKVVYEGAGNAPSGQVVGGGYDATADSNRETSGGPAINSDAARRPFASESSGRGEAPSEVSDHSALPGRRPGQREGLGIGNGHLALADQQTQARPAALRRQDHRGQRKDAKRYQLLDGKGRFLGPLAATEIQSLFFKGVLDKGVVVMRLGSSARVPVAKFVAVYAETGGRPSQRRAQATQPAKRLTTTATLIRAAIAQQGRIIAARETLTIVTVIVGALLLGVAGFIVFGSGAHGPDWFTSEAPPAKTEEKPRPLPDYAASTLGKKSPATKPAAGTLKQEKFLKSGQSAESGKFRQAKGQVKPRPSQVLPKSRVDNLRLKSPGANRKSQVANQPVRPTKAKNLVKPRQAPQKAKLKGIPPARRVVTNSQGNKRPVRPAAARPQAAARVVPPTVPVKTPPASGPKISQLVNGQTVRGLGPLSYDKVEIEICEGTCNVTMKGAGGAVQVSFFKSAYEGVLMRKNGPVLVSGLVRKKGSTVKIILSGVQ